MHASASVPLSEGLLSLIGGLLSADSTKGPPDRRLSPELRAAADEILAAEERETVLDLLDELWPVLARAPSTGGRASTLRKAKSSFAKGLDTESLERVVGVQGAALCEEAMEYARQLIERTLGTLTAGALGSDTQDTQVPHRDSTDFLFDLSLPLAFRKGYASLLRAIATMAVIARAEEHGTRLTPWLSLCLCETLRDGFKIPALAVDRFMKNPLGGASRWEEMNRDQDALRRMLDEVWDSYDSEQTPAP